ncbi:MAG: YggS family pyridoxal phosphate-dependent enzyme, partial [Paludibacteraceae bacterium]|nr:YggS family pyridoxal phosphate-dependent enzyme [Paludibacteraceae bacterium]
MLITDNLNKVRAHIPAGVTLVCVSKFQPVEAIREAYEAGERHFGESRVQELKAKIPQLPSDIHWHFIGHLQTNKVRDLIKLRPYLIHSVDSQKLLEAINDEAAKTGIIQDVLLEVHVAREETKTGLLPDQIGGILDLCRDKMQHIRICGLMCMATNTDDEAEIRRCFTETRELLSSFGGAVLSMGMSEDYPIAIECGANMVRIGSSIFGERKKMPKAVFFDQDGILYNSMPYHAESWAYAMTKHGLPYTPEECYRNEGRTSTGVIQEYYLRIFGKEASPEIIQAIYADKTEHFNEMTGGFPGTIPGVSDVLHFLYDHGVQCWVVTGSGQHNLIDALNETFDHVFTGIISSFDVLHGKPDPEPYLKAWSRSGFKKEECMVVENAPLGVRAAKAAELFTCAVNTGPLPDSDLAAEGADRIFPDMYALL